MKGTFIFAVTSILLATIALGCGKLLEKKPDDACANYPLASSSADRYRMPEAAQNDDAYGVARDFDTFLYGEGLKLNASQPGGKPGWIIKAGIKETHIVKEMEGTFAVFTVWFCVTFDGPEQSTAEYQRVAHTLGVDQLLPGMPDGDGRAAMADVYFGIFDGSHWNIYTSINDVESAGVEDYYLVQMVKGLQQQKAAIARKLSTGDPYL
jgi:hypothetical protein